MHLYEDDGVACLRRLRGMFGFALRGSRRRLMLARDRLEEWHRQHSKPREGGRLPMAVLSIQLWDALFLRAREPFDSPFVPG